MPSDELSKVRKARIADARRNGHDDLATDYEIVIRELDTARRDSDDWKKTSIKYEAAWRQVEKDLHEVIGADLREVIAARKKAERSLMSSNRALMSSEVELTKIRGELETERAACRKAMKTLRDTPVIAYQLKPGDLFRIKRAPEDIHTVSHRDGIHIVTAGPDELGIHGETHVIRVTWREENDDAK